ncbi:hypothetical protein ES703_55194 [subsurface metagenome]
MPVQYRQKSFSDLTPEQQALKLEADAKYEADVHILDDPFYKKKHTIGVTPAEDKAHGEAKTKLWDNYYQWAVANDLYEIISPEAQLAEIEARLYRVLDPVNELRGELGRRPLEIKERQGAIPL